jgi:hypothetical protein
MHKEVREPSELGDLQHSEAEPGMKEGQTRTQVQVAKLAGLVQATRVLS